MPIYVLDNNKRYTAHALYLIGAEKEEFDKIWSLYQKAWPRESCGNSSCRYHRSNKPCTLVAILDKIEWYEGAPASITSCLYDIETGLDNYTANIEAAREFVELAKTYVADFSGEPFWSYFCITEDK